MPHQIMPLAVSREDASLSKRERHLIGVSIAAMHLFLTLWVLGTDGQGLTGAVYQAPGISSGLEVTFVALAPPTTPAAVTHISVSPIVRSESSRDEEIAQAEVAEAQRLAQPATQARTPEGPPTAMLTIQRNAATSSLATSSAADDDNLAAYHAALRRAIHRKWSELTERPFPDGCALRLALATGGSVNASSATACVIEEEDRLQLEAAALMAQPLPYQGYETVFAPEMLLHF